MKHLRYLQFVLPLFMIIGGSSYLLWPQVTNVLMGSNYQPSVVQAKATQRSFSLNTVEQLQVPKLGIDLPVSIGAYNAAVASWTLDNHQAFIVPQSATPLLYGHATSGVFGKLTDIKPGEQLLLQTNLQSYLFTYLDSEVIAPDDVAILQKHYPHTLLLMTCSGLFSEDRRVFKFVYQGEAA